MSTIKAPTTYRDIAGLRGQVALLYHELGSYQGEWMMVARDPDHYFVYRGGYGSCSGCDDLQATFSYAEDVSQEKIDEWLADNLPFIEIPRATARNLVIADTLKQVFPANVRETYSDIPYDQLIEEATLLIKLEEDLPVTFEETLATRNQETRRRIIERDGIADFMAKADAHILHVDGFDKLVCIKDGSIYLWLQDASTDREYVLRVPNTMKRVREAKAWTFGIKEVEYAPLIET